MKKYFVMAAVLATTFISLPAKTQAQTYGGFYGGYGNNAYLDRALAVRKSKRRVKSSKRVVRKKSSRRTVRTRRSYRRSRR